MTHERAPSDRPEPTSLESIELPSPTAWPFVLAFGVALTFAGLATHALISVLGLVLAACAALGWFGQVLPEEEHETVAAASVAPSMAALPLRPRDVGAVAIPLQSRPVLPRTELPEAALSRVELSRTEPRRTELPLTELSRAELAQSELPEAARSRAEVPRRELSRAGLSRAEQSRATPSRAELPRESYPVSAGLRGGLAGAAVMAALAMAYGVVSGTSVWYPINLLAAGFLPPSVDASTAALAAFNLQALSLATAIHLIASLLVGLLYGAMLPMLPRRPILLGGLVAPLFWSGLLHGLLGIINPVMNLRIDWLWFVLSQVGFGMTAGIVVSRMQRVMPVMPVMPVVIVVLAIGGASAGAIGCDDAPGRAAMGAPETSPDRTLDFAVLYRTNCAGCHGLDGRGGAALALANPTYLAIADDEVIRRAMADGIRGTAMPAFARRSGGPLTDDQVDAIVGGIRRRWGSQADHSATREASAARDLPPYAESASASATGDAHRGAAVFDTYCQQCHGGGGQGGSRASSIVDPAYLALVSDQGLRTTIIAGRPELGAPDWRGNLPGRAMTSQEIADVVAWLSAQRPRFADSSSRDSSPSSRP